jgi:hypothetical protein
MFRWLGVSTEKDLSLSLPFAESPNNSQSLCCNFFLSQLTLLQTVGDGGASGLNSDCFERGKYLIDGGWGWRRGKRGRGLLPGCCMFGPNCPLRADS